MNIKLITYPFLFILLLGFLQPINAQKRKKRSKKNRTQKVLNTRGIDNISDDESKAEYLFIKAEGYYLNQEYAKAKGLFKEVLKISPKKSACYYKISQCELLMGNSGEAIVNAKKSLEYNKSNKTYYLFAADLLKREDKLEKAAMVYDEMFQNISKETAGYYFNQYEIYKELENRETQKKTTYTENGLKASPKRLKELNTNINNYRKKAIASLNNLEDNFGVNQDITTRKQEIYLSSGDLDQAIKEGEKLIESNPKEVNYRFALADLLIHHKKEKEAVAYMEKVTSDFPESPTANLILADYYSLIGEDQKSDEEINKAFSKESLSIDDKVRIISDILNAGRSQSARSLGLELARKANKAHSDKPQTYSILADALLLNGEIRSARDMYKEVIRRDSTREIIWDQLISLDSEIKDTEAIIKHTEEGIKLFPENLKFYLINGSTRLLNKEYEKAKKVLEEGRDQSLTSRNFRMENEFLMRLGDAYHNLELYKDSDKAFEKALEIDPNNLYVLNNYSYYLSLREDNLDIASANGERLVRMKPREGAYLDTYAWILYKTGDYKKARKYIDRALEQTSDGTILEHAGDIYFKLNLKKEALNFWEKAKIAGGTSEFIDKKINEKRLVE